MSLREFITTLQYHDTLNPVLWDNDHLKPLVRKHLLMIAAKWAEYANIPTNAIINIVMTGGNANYNFGPTSDIDVHLLIDPTKMSIKDPVILQDMIFDKKGLWAQKHNITVYGYPIELFAQPINEKTPVQQGVYSLTHDKWVIQPNNLHLDFNNDFALQNKVEYEMHRIDRTLKTGTVDDAEHLRNTIVVSRGEALKRSGEFATGTLVYKELRNRGYLQRLTDFINSSLDQKLSL